ncbi:MAG: site-specific DNA-methyltransferase [Planctomycetes bacterium]|nr:site-specific DNA-methyltransferase [Planctomycetota bacterium]
MSLQCQTWTEIPSDWNKADLRPGTVDAIIAVPPFRSQDLGLPVCLDAIRNRGWPFIRWVRQWLLRSTRLLRPRGHFYVYGPPAWMPHWIQPLDEHLEFRYWVGIQTAGKVRRHRLKAEHMSLAFYCPRDAAFHCNPVRYPHPRCAACGKTLKDYGGRAHLLDPGGCLISDVWKDLEIDPEEEGIPRPVLERILALSRPGWVGTALILQPRKLACPPLPRAFQLELPYEKPRPVAPALLGQVHQADILAFLQRLPNACVDLAFADPPYNLQKAYSDYIDGQTQERYLQWCETWLADYIRVLKPGGSLFVLNLPRWSTCLARFLSQHLFLQNWIVWDALAEPRGKILPAHYALLYATRGPVPSTFNYHGFSPQPGDVLPPDAPVYCLRVPCRRGREALGHQLHVELSDIWTDIHRVRHQRHRDVHPCQLPESLMERIIRLASHPGDVVLDALCGTGTTALVARRLGRRFLAAELDPNYVKISQRKLSQLEELGEVARPPTRKAKPPVSLKTLQLELVRLCQELGREPTLEDVRARARYPAELYQAHFPHWSRALRAVRVLLRSAAPSPVAEPAENPSETHESS